MIKDDGSFDPRSCRVFGLAAHTLAVLMGSVIHNLKQTRRTRARRAADTPTTDGQPRPNTTPASATPPSTSLIPTRAPPLAGPGPRLQTTSSSLAQPPVATRGVTNADVFCQA